MQNVKLPDLQVLPQTPPGQGIKLQSFSQNCDGNMSCAESFFVRPPRSQASHLDIKLISRQSGGQQHQLLLRTRLHESRNEEFQ